MSRADYVQLTTQNRGWTSPVEGYVPVGNFMETLTVVHAIKSELPNTHKRMTRQTYRNYLITKNRQAA